MPRMKVRAPDTAAGVQAVLTAAVDRAFQIADERDTAHTPGEMSMSQVGRCLRQSAYRVAGRPYDEGLTDRSGRAAWLGTWLHAGLLPLLRRALPGARYEMPVTLAHNGLAMKGRTDMWWRGVVLDKKTVRDYGLAWARRDGPKASVRAQAATYAYAHEQAGRDVVWLAYLYLERGTGATEVIVEPWTDELRSMVKARLNAIEAAALLPELAEREERGPGLSIVCDGCPWLRSCWGPTAVPGATGPQTQLIDSEQSAADVLAMYATAAATEARAKKDKEFARAMLADTAPGVYGAYSLAWKGGGGGKDAPDADAMEARLRELGEPVPMKWAGGRKASIDVKLAKTRPDASQVTGT